ncbi:DUF411 domain-containing protein [Sphingosinicella rhizophila]|uniref:DUF411 domain-containing protein n=1 Tax=Sphingosinicella rhizophila TaxID=3050082 RepID=A0ABU3QBT0_9SPHN|nr:DUF411 domain-containing protein [Sphingosinicella sp. GR2756]MDT9600866.1 DUF411 domain-containing protein [Sphingosinicella sp. GR2756]
MQALLGIPAHFCSCHTAQIAGYAIEGHVSAADVKLPLTERPKGAGIAMPGMVVDFSAMEQSKACRTILFDRPGKTTFPLLTESAESQVWTNVRMSCAAPMSPLHPRLLFCRTADHLMHINADPP